MHNCNNRHQHLENANHCNTYAPNPRQQIDNQCKNDSDTTEFSRNLMLRNFSGSHP